MATVVVHRREGKTVTSYVVQYRDPVTGRKKHHKTFRKLRDAQQSANELRSMLDLGETPKKRVRLQPLTFSEVADAQIEEWKQSHLLGELRKKTITEYITRLQALERTFGELFMAQLTVEMITSYRAGVAIEKSNVSANKDLQIIKQVIKKAFELQALKNDPAIGIKKLSEKEHERNRYLLPHELETLLNAAKTGRAQHYLPALVLLGAEHGASTQECLDLKWTDIDFGYQKFGLIRFFRTKNNRERTELLMPRTKQALLSWRKHLEYRRRRAKCRVLRDDVVFCRINGTPKKRFARAFRAACKRAKIKDFHFHDLRHTFCSNLILAGAGLKDAKEMIGHADISMTDRYSHLTIQHKHLVQQMLAKHYVHAVSPD